MKKTVLSILLLFVVCMTHAQSPNHQNAQLIEFSVQYIPTKPLGNGHPKSPDEWDLTIVNANTGATAYTEKVKGQYARFNTSGWKPGVYIIACEVDGKVISKKTTIK